MLYELLLYVKTIEQTSRKVNKYCIQIYNIIKKWGYVIENL